MNQYDNFEIYTSDDLCKIFKVSKNTMQKWLKADILPVVKIGKKYRTSNRLINDWLKRNIGKTIDI